MVCGGRGDGFVVCFCFVWFRPWRKVVHKVPTREWAGAALVGAAGSCGQLSGACFHGIRPLRQDRISAGRVAMAWRSRVLDGSGDGYSRASIRRYLP